MTSEQIACLAGVARSTVSRVLNNHPSVTPETREKILKIIEENNYVPNATARSLGGKPPKVIGLFILDFFHDGDAFTVLRSHFYLEYTAYVTDFARSLGYNTLISIIRQDNPDEMERLLSGNIIAGAIVMGDGVDEGRLLRLLANGFKVTLYNEVHRSIHPNMIVVNYDNVQSGERACQTLVDKGHRRIAHLTGDVRKLSVQDRLAGYKNVLKKHKIAIDNRLIVTNMSFHRPEGGMEAVRTLFQRVGENEWPTALCCGSSSMAIGVLKELARLNIRVPDDISVIGIDGVEASRHTDPPLSEIIQTGYPAVSELLVTKLVELIEKGSVDRRDYQISDMLYHPRESIKSL